MRQRGVAFPVEIDHPHGVGEERLEPGDVVAHIVHQLRVARGVRTVRLVDQLASVGGAVEHHLLPPRRGQCCVIAEHAAPGGARMRRLDQRIRQVAQQPFVVGELELRRAQADAAGHLAADPAMHVVVEEVLAGTAEIAAAAAAECCACQNQRQQGRVDPGLPRGPDRKARRGHCKFPDVSVDGDGHLTQRPLPVRHRRWFCRARVRSG
jgi:hypothetical protein